MLKASRDQRKASSLQQREKKIAVSLGPILKAIFLLFLSFLPRNSELTSMDMLLKYSLNLIFSFNY